MTRGWVLALIGGAGLAAAAGLLAVGGGATVRAAGSGIALRLGLSAGDDGHLAPASSFGGFLHPRHSLYRRLDGHAMRAVLTTPGGWSWFADPPSEETL